MKWGFMSFTVSRMRSVYEYMVFLGRSHFFETSQSTAYATILISNTQDVEESKPYTDAKINDLH